jgi:uncharacterized protein YbjT (DUF2867 family)
MKKTAVVFGATGLVGKELVAELLSQDEFEKVIIVVRRELLLRDPKLEQLLLKDFADLENFRAGLHASDYYCCIGTTIKIAGSQDAFYRVDHDIPLQIARLAEELAVPNLVVISSIGADASSRNFYLRTKGEMENDVQAAYHGNLKIVRPSLLMGLREEHRFGEKTANVVMKAIGWLFIGPLRKYRGIHARDVAKSMIRATRLTADRIWFESDELTGL